MVNQYEDIVDTEISSNTEALSYIVDAMEIGTILYFVAVIAIPYDGDQYDTCSVYRNTVQWRSFTIL